MKFDLDSRIQAIEARNQKITDDIKSQRASLPLYFLFMSSNAIYFFDFIKTILNIGSTAFSLGNLLFLLIFSPYIITLIVSLIYFVEVFRFGKIKHPPILEGVYRQIDNYYRKYPNPTKEEIEIIEEAAKSHYLKKLNECFAHNFRFYSEKQKNIGKTILFSLRAILFYVLAIIFYTLKE